MRAIEIAEPGGPEQLQLTERPKPEPGPGQVLIKIAAAGVNMPDVIQRRGAYPPPPGVTDIPGLEVAGEIVALGEGVIQLREGDPVCALLSGGGYAEYAVSDQQTVLPQPRGLDSLHSAGIPETFFTVWDALFERCRLKAGESVLIHGGAGGIGSTAIQLAKALGAGQVLTTARHAQGQKEACERFGADRVIDYTREAFEEVVLELSDQRGVDVILDIIGGDYIQRNIKALALEGRLLNLNYMGGFKAEVDFQPVMRKRLTLMANTLRARSAEDKGWIAAKLREHVWPLLEQGRVKPSLYKVLPMQEAAEGHRILEAGGHVGKVILRWAP
jgi:NADPH2:quinone reductase